MGLETFALINDKDQVVNHVVIDKESSNFEEVMADQLEHWSCVRYVETTDDKPIIVLDEDPEIWTTHTEEEGFVLPEAYQTKITMPETVKKKSELPTDSLLLEENASKRPEGWKWPEGLTIIEG